MRINVPFSTLFVGFRYKRVTVPLHEKWRKRVSYKIWYNVSFQHIGATKSILFPKEMPLPKKIILNYTIILKIPKVPLFGNAPPPHTHTHFLGASAAYDYRVLKSRFMSRFMRRTYAYGQNPLFELIYIRFGTWKVRLLN